MHECTVPPPPGTLSPLPATVLMTPAHENTTQTDTAGHQYSPWARVPQSRKSGGQLAARGYGQRHDVT